MGLCFTQGKKKKEKKGGKQKKNKKNKQPADCAPPGGHAGDLHQGWQSGRGQLSQRS